MVGESDLRTHCLNFDLFDFEIYYDYNGRFIVRHLIWQIIVQTSISLVDDDRLNPTAWKPSAGCPSALAELYFRLSTPTEILTYKVDFVTLSGANLFAGRPGCIGHPPEEAYSAHKP